MCYRSEWVLWSVWIGFSVSVSAIQHLNLSQSYSNSIESQDSTWLDRRGVMILNHERRSPLGCIETASSQINNKSGLFTHPCIPKDIIIRLRVHIQHSGNIPDKTGLLTSIIPSSSEPRIASSLLHSHHHSSSRTYPRVKPITRNPGSRV